jgi:hypothetical protein
MKPFTKKSRRSSMKKDSVLSGLFLALGHSMGFGFALLVLSGTLASAQTYSSSKAPRGTQAPKSPAIARNPAKTGMSTQPAGSSHTVPAAPVQITDQSQVQRLGGTVYSTGAEDVIVKILERTRQPTPNGVMTNVSAFNSGIYLVSTTPERFIGFPRQGGKVMNLGKLPPGELVFAIKTPEQRVFQTGPASRNPDGFEHAIIRSFPSGTIEVWFEDLNQTGDRDFNDAVIQLYGGVADNSAVADLLKIIKEQKGEVRDAAISALKVINPKALAGVALNAQ